ncbi:DUF2938 family protein [Kaustia mangrovi]|uniref:DUF2938 family protein n=1 Tax=Kaustia mangrovi TaxID=2593653 RepID=A0A7S8C5B1_9HYPH|nr:DUF2938 family protein [Kaustia mangrovi]QPC43597.1 DUF2938 family protein [Kaustia mangrovi]
MSDFAAIFGHAVPVGIVATLVMDAVAVLRGRILRTATLDYRLVGRWIGHMPRGRFVHAPITASPPVPGEAVIGWTAHYLIGIGFAAGLVAIADWPPSAGACLLAGLATSTAPFLILQPGLGLGIAAAKTPAPNAARRSTLVTHLSFGLGLYLGVAMLSALP